MWTRVSWVLSVTEHPGLSFTPCAAWEHSVSLGHMSNARHEKTFPRGTQNYTHLLSGYQKLSSCFPSCLILLSILGVPLFSVTTKLSSRCQPNYFWIMTPQGFTIHLFCLSKHVRLVLTTWMPGLRRCISGNSLVTSVQFCTQPLNPCQRHK